LLSGPYTSVGQQAKRGPPARVCACLYLRIICLRRIQMSLAVSLHQHTYNNIIVHINIHIHTIYNIIYTRGARVYNINSGLKMFKLAMNRASSSAAAVLDARYKYIIGTHTSSIHIIQRHPHTYLPICNI